MSVKIKCPKCGCEDFTISIEYASRDEYFVRNKKLTFNMTNISRYPTGEIYLCCADCLQEREDEDPTWRPSEEERLTIHGMIMTRQIADVSEFFKDEDIPEPKRPEPELIEEGHF